MFRCVIFFRDNSSIYYWKKLKRKNVWFWVKQRQYWHYNEVLFILFLVIEIKLLNHKFGHLCRNASLFLINIPIIEKKWRWGSTCCCQISKELLFLLALKFIILMVTLTFQLSEIKIFKKKLILEHKSFQIKYLLFELHKE